MGIRLMGTLESMGGTAWLAAREAAFLASSSTPAEIEWQERALVTMRAIAATPDTGTRYAVGAEMDRHYTAHDIALAEERLARCKAYAASLAQQVAA
ncbi:hypothetical protein [Sandarakinorhabdus sp. DWP1-3-1]|uniref:hypothetical protein n=1 Tax=Sandarakinorhabdus sp. DWP1-3-1 TaxID=2804627 RepID=UPI003CF6382F